MSRLIEKMVCLGLVTAWRLATWPTSRSPALVNATTEGVVRPPSALGMTTGSPPSITATTELVVPRSIPITLSAILGSPESQIGLGHSWCYEGALIPRHTGLRQVEGRLFLPYRRKFPTVGP